MSVNFIDSMINGSVKEFSRYNNTLPKSNSSGDLMQKYQRRNNRKSALNLRVTNDFRMERLLLKIRLKDLKSFKKSQVISSMKFNQRLNEMVNPVELSNLPIQRRFRKKLLDWFVAQDTQDHKNRFVTKGWSPPSRPRDRQIKIDRPKLSRPKNTNVSTSHVNEVYSIFNLVDMASSTFNT